MFLSSAHETLDCYNRRFYDPQFIVARQKSQPSKQKRYGFGYLS